jgi:hypothetical protein
MAWNLIKNSNPKVNENVSLVMPEPQKVTEGIKSIATAIHFCIEG